MSPSSQPNGGHRQRLREKYLKSGPDAFFDYELLELLLSFSILRRDVKPVAKALLAEFVTLGSLIDAPIEKIAQVPGVGEQSAILIKLARDFAVRYLEQKVLGNPVLRCNETLCNLIRMKMGEFPEEKMMAIYLNVKGQMIDWEILSTGAVDRVLILPVTVAKQALLHNAKRVIMCHNHPSGQVAPSSQDAALTAKIRSALAPLEIFLLDHIIVSKFDAFSFRSDDRGKPFRARILEPFPEEIAELQAMEQTDNNNISKN